MQAADSAGTLPVSVDRVRAELERPAVLNLTLPDVPVHFRIEVRERPLFSELPPIDFGGGTKRPPVPFWVPSSVPQVGVTPALAGVDLLAVGRYVANSVSAARRARAQREAQEEVQRALREFCATTKECEVR
jgi:hypothetical protein